MALWEGAPASAVSSEHLCSASLVRQAAARFPLAAGSAIPCALGAVCRRRGCPNCGVRRRCKSRCCDSGQRWVVNRCMINRCVVNRCMINRCVINGQTGVWSAGRCIRRGEESVIQSVRLHSAQKVGRIHEAVVLLALPFQADDVVCWADVEILPDNWLSQHVVHFEDSHGAVRRVIGLVCCEVKYFHLDLRELVGATNEHQGQEHPR